MKPANISITYDSTCRSEAKNWAEETISGMELRRENAYLHVGDAG